MKKILPKQIAGILNAITAISKKMGCRSYIVGGLVRDMLLGVKNFDLDIVIEGNAIRFGKLLAKTLKGTLVVHKQFGTATVFIDWPKGVTKPLFAGKKFKIDLARARRESYEKPAALPTVEFCSLRNDLSRRDFSINAMAVSLNKYNFGELMDFFNGAEDLKNKKIHVLHRQSFIDDPTRIFRAVRFEQRYGFKIDRHTEHLIKNAVKKKMFKKTQNQRIREEVIHILKEPFPIKAIMRLKELHELKFLHENIVINPSTERLFKRIKEEIGLNKRSKKRKPLDEYLIYLLGLLDNLTAREAKGFLDKFVFQKNDKKKILNYKTVLPAAGRILSKKTKVRPSEIYDTLKNRSCETLIMLKTKIDNRTASSRISAFINKYSGIKLKLDGHDLKKIGIKPGPRFKILMTSVLYAKIDNGFKLKKDEMLFLKHASKQCK